MRTPALTPDIPVVSGFQKIALVSIPVPFRKPGNITGRLLTFFEVHSDGAMFRAIPLSSLHHKTLTNLPESISFLVEDGNIVEMDNFYSQLVEEIAKELQKLGHL